jgi:hypothetical protein
MNTDANRTADMSGIVLRCALISTLLILTSVMTGDIVSFITLFIFCVSSRSTLNHHLLGDIYNNTILSFVVPMCLRGPASTKGQYCPSVLLANAAKLTRIIGLASNGRSESKIKTLGNGGIDRASHWTSGHAGFEMHGPAAKHAGCRFVLDLIGCAAIHQIPSSIRKLFGM